MFHSIKKNTVLIFSILITAVILLTPGISRARVHGGWDWTGTPPLRTLKVCLQDADCPAGMEDSLKKAIDFWNAEDLSWTLEYMEGGCDGTEQVKVKCGEISGLGLWEATSTNGIVTTSTVTINKDTDWGTCDDKVELVSTLVHELGHAMRLRNVPGQNDIMRGGQAPAGHLYDPTTNDSTEAAQSDGTMKADTDTTPPGAEKQTYYDGVITPHLGANPFYLDEADAVMVFPFNPLSLLNVSAHIEGSESVHWSCDIAEGADLSEAFTLEIDYGDSVVNRQGYLSVVDPDWDETWMPTAVAPSDTSVPNENSMIILDATGSYHPAGPEAMIFEWSIDDGELGVVLGEPITSVYLPAGDHAIELTAQDDFGNLDSDMMFVDVGVEDIPTLHEWGLIILGLLLLTAGTIAIVRKRKAAAARAN